jgi:hypothetical protein
MVYLGEGVESVMGTISFCCITRFLIGDHNALAMLYTRTLASNARVLSRCDHQIVGSCYANVLEKNPALSAVNIGTRRFEASDLASKCNTSRKRS